MTASAAALASDATLSASEAARAASDTACAAVIVRSLTTYTSGCEPRGSAASTQVMVLHIQHTYVSDNARRQGLRKWGRGHAAGAAVPSPHHQAPARITCCWVEDAQITLSHGTKALSCTDSRQSSTLHSERASLSIEGNKVNGTLESVVGGIAGYWTAPLWKQQMDCATTCTRGKQTLGINQCSSSTRCQHQTILGLANQSRSAFYCRFCSHRQMQTRHCNLILSDERSALTCPRAHRVRRSAQSCRVLKDL